jgi:lipopolysaccharide/colanic/teichoic acid biosynthesis glycosyltransferase
MEAGTAQASSLQASEAEPSPGIVQSIVALAALSALALPAMLAAGLLWISLGRPLLFRQVRSGLHARPFTVIKFRTMHDTRDAAGQLLPDAERETSVSRLIRGVRLDEIPQLLMVLKGSMNIVGPRPLRPATIESFGSLGRIRSQVRPGLTGWAQVNGNTRLSDAQKLALDIWYIDHRSVALDGQILLLTVWTVMFGERINADNLAAATAHLATRTSAVTNASAGGKQQ